MSKTSEEMKVFNLFSTTAVIEPFHICSFENGLKFPALFPPRSVQSVEMFIERSRAGMEAIFEDNVLEASYENFYYPTENHYTLNGDGLLSVCMRTHDNDKKKHHKICIYDHITNKLKFLGNIPRHTFVDDIDKSVFCSSDPKRVEGVIGALTHDSRYVIVLAYSRTLFTVSVFDIWNTCCILGIDCSEIEFLKCHPNGIALNPQGVLQGRFQVALQNEDMEIRLWEATTRSEYVAKLEDVHSVFGYGNNIINSRESTLKFTPNGRLLCVPGYFWDEKTCKCIFLDAQNLEPFCVMPYGGMCYDMYSMFPCFTSCGSKFAVLSVEHEHDFYDLEKYRCLYFEIPPRMESLKELCRCSILKSVHFSMLEKLPLPSDLIAFLGGSMSGQFAIEKKHCTLM